MQYGLFKNNVFSKGYVVFEHDNSLWWLRFLRPGFRHCYVILEYQDFNNRYFWLELNPMSNQIYAFIHNSELKIDYSSYLQKKESIHMIPFKFTISPLKCAPFGVFSCVEFVKRILGIHDFFIFTPYQLYKKITKYKRL